jgi:[acyl-carrier-protein] S-malonyltransferase
MIAFVFPGQGSQKVGMGVELAAASPAARAVFDEVNDALSQNLFAIMRDGPEDALTLTENAQPAIMAHSLAIARVLEREFGISLAQKGEAVAQQQSLPRDTFFPQDHANLRNKRRST